MANPTDAPVDAVRAKQIEWFRATRFLYELVDPRDDTVHYVGCSVNPLKRLRSHVRRSHNNDVRLWIKELRSLALAPQLRVVCEAGCHLVAQDLEQRHIDKVDHTLGNRLSNRLKMLPVRRVFDFQRMQTRRRMARNRAMSYVKRQSRRLLIGSRCQHDANRQRQWRIEFNGRIYGTRELAELCGISRQRMYQRLLKYSVDEAVGVYLNKIDQV